MKHITTILLTLFVMSCSCQEPDTHSYSDSLFQSTIDSINAEHEIEMDYKDSVILDRDIIISNLQSVLDTYDNSELSVIADTFNLEISDDRTKIEVNKLGHDCHVEIIDGNKRIDAYYVDYKRTVNLTE